MKSASFFTLVQVLLIPSSAAFVPGNCNIVSKPNLGLDMVARNPNFAKLAGGYLFPEIGRRRSQYVKENPDMADRIVSLGIGDTTQPIPSHILSGLVEGASKLGTKSGYSGYGDVEGQTDLRKKIAETLYSGIIDPDEVFVSGTLLLFLVGVRPTLWMGFRTSNTYRTFLYTIRWCKMRHHATAANVWTECSNRCARSIVSSICGYFCHVGADRRN
jgi:hypothetical protein